MTLRVYGMGTIHQERRWTWTALVAVAIGYGTLGTQPCRPSEGTHGAPKGALVLCGGGSLRDVAPRFLELAGGPRATLVVIPTAMSDAKLRDVQTRTRIVKAWREHGFSRVLILHTRDPRQADQESFFRPIVDAQAVWFTGGRQWRLVDAYLGTKTVTALQTLLARGGVIGGTSAGATVQGSFLFRGDSRSNQILVGDHRQGFGFLENAAVDQHWSSRGRQSDLAILRTDFPHLLGLGIDEGTAAVVQADVLEVIGVGEIGVYDGSSVQPQRGERVPDIVLSPGARYDLKVRNTALGKEPRSAR